MFSVWVSLMGAFCGLSVHGAASRKYFDFYDSTDELAKFIFMCLVILAVTTTFLGVLVLVASPILKYSRDCKPEDIPYYPIRQVKEKELLKKHVERAKKETGISFVGRLGTYRYLDMDVTISEALKLARQSIKLLSEKKEMPTFFEEVV